MSGLPAASITAGYLPGSSSGPSQSTVEAASGPNPQTQDGTNGTLLMDTGLKSQQLHTAQWNLDRLDQAQLPLNQSFRLVLLSDLLVSWVRTQVHERSPAGADVSM